MVQVKSSDQLIRKLNIGRLRTGKLKFALHETKQALTNKEKISNEVLIITIPKYVMEIITETLEEEISRETQQINTWERELSKIENQRNEKKRLWKR